eukprot:scaffold58867_cov65-Phaeocystis_antarctica.AAC.7
MACGAHEELRLDRHVCLVEVQRRRRQRCGPNIAPTDVAHQGLGRGKGAVIHILTEPLPLVAPLVRLLLEAALPLPSACNLAVPLRLPRHATSRQPRPRAA